MEQERVPMISQDFMRIMQEEREREVKAHLRVRRLLGGGRPLIHWRPRRRPLGGDSGGRG
jgi:hypothetical protein